MIASIISGWGGAFIAGYYSRRAAIDALDKERSIGKEEKQKKKKRELIDLYIHIIKIDYGNQLAEYSQSGFAILNFETYNEHIRNQIYKKYHLVHETVIKEFNKIEKINQKLRYNEFYADQSEMLMDEDKVVTHYNNMIKEIKKLLDNERVSV